MTVDCDWIGNARFYNKMIFFKGTIMNKKTSIFLISIVFAATCFAADGDTAGVALPGKDTSEYWIIRSQALTELTPFLTRSRTEAKGYYNALTDFLKSIEKGKEFAKSNIKAHLNPADYAKAIGKTERFVEKNIDLPTKPMTWEQLVDFAMGFVLQEGYIPTDVSDNKEIKLIKKICQQKEKYGRKVRDELRKIAQNCMDMKAYLESIDQFEAGKRYTQYQKEEKEKARIKKAKEGKEGLAAKERRRRELHRKNEWQERQKRLKDHYYGGRYYRGRHYRTRPGYRYYYW